MGIINGTNLKEILYFVTNCQVAASFVTENMFHYNWMTRETQKKLNTVYKNRNQFVYIST